MNDKTAEFTDQDKADLASIGIAAEEPKKRTLLATWKEVLSNIEASRDAKIPAKVAMRIVAAWPELHFGDLSRYHELYHQFLLEQRGVFERVLAEYPKAFENVEDDAEANRAVYLELLFAWQHQGLLWEHEWSVDDPNAAILVAAIEDAMSFFVGGQGLVGHLESIQFAYDETDRDALAARLTAAKEGL